MPDTAACIAAVEKENNYFTKTDIIRPTQDASLEKIVCLFQEEQDSTRLSAATKSRRKAARTLLRDILQRICVDVFFLCAFALPITWLGTIKAPNDFVERLQSWWSNAKPPIHLRKLIPRLIGKFQNTVQFNKACERGYSDSCTVGGERVLPSPNKDVGDSQIDDGHGLALDSESEESEEGEEPDHPDQLEAPMNGNVYELGTVDAIRVLTTSEAVPILTIPHYQGVKPFITFRVPEKLAMQLMMGRKQLM
ncbi:hypothetical protein VTG60DRAFT_7356 [Thermothelomyces hinnuleus]